MLEEAVQGAGERGCRETILGVKYLRSRCKWFGSRSYGILILILHRIASNYYKLSVLGNILSDSKTCPCALLHTCAFKLLPDPLPEYPFTDMAPLKVCHLRLSSTWPLPSS